jgi:hypothetical protein
VKTSHWGQACAAAIIGTALASAPALAGPKLFAYLGSTMTFNGTTETTANNMSIPLLWSFFRPAKNV